MSPRVPIVRAVDLTRRYDGLVAVDRLSLELHPGELFGFLGPNGAGKTTTLRLLTGLLRPTAGEVYIGPHSLAREPERAKALFGFVPDTPFLYDKLTAREYFAFVAGLYRVPPDLAERRSTALLKLLDLEEAADALTETYSHGMRQKTALGGALVHDPPVVLLDEPTLGLDPRSARTIRDLLRGLCARGKAVLLSTHVLEIAERVCDRVGILHQGRLLVVGTMDELRRTAHSGGSLEEIFLALTGGRDDEDLRAFLDATRPGPPGHPTQPIQPMRD